MLVFPSLGLNNDPLITLAGLHLLHFRFGCVTSRHVCSVGSTRAQSRLVLHVVDFLCLLHNSTEGTQAGDEEIRQQRARNAPLFSDLLPLHHEDDDLSDGDHGQDAAEDTALAQAFVGPPERVAGDDERDDAQAKVVKAAAQRVLPHVGLRGWGLLRRHLADKVTRATLHRVLVSAEDMTTRGRKPVAFPLERLQRVWS